MVRGAACDCVVAMAGACVAREGGRGGCSAVVTRSSDSMVTFALMTTARARRGAKLATQFRQSPVIDPPLGTGGDGTTWVYGWIGRGVV